MPFRSVRGVGIALKDGSEISITRPVEMPLNVHIRIGDDSKSMGTIMEPKMRLGHLEKLTVYNWITASINSGRLDKSPFDAILAPQGQKPKS